MKTRLVVAVGVSALLIGFALLRAQPTRPNIIWILTDDLDDVSFRAALDAGLLPSIKARLVDVGMVADNYFNVISLCCPARGGLLNGQYPQNNHVISNDYLSGILSFDESHALPVWLQTAGYLTMHVGKYLNGYGVIGQTDPSSNPLSAKHVPPGWTIWQALDDGGTYTDYDHDWTIKVGASATSFYDDRPLGVIPLNYHTDMVSLRFLVGLEILLAAKQPFYAESTPTTPHFHILSRDNGVIVNACPNGVGSPSGGGSLWGITALSPPRYVDTVHLPLPMSPAFNAGRTGKPGPINTSPTLSADDIACVTKVYNQRIEQLRAVDDMVAGVFHVLDSAGATANTIVGLSSDNGYLLGEFGLIEKSWPYERSIRVPLAIAGPGIPGRHTKSLLTDRDIAVTFADLAGAAPQLVTDGRSFVSELRNTASVVRYATLVMNATSTLDGPIHQVPSGKLLVPSAPFIGVRTATRKAIFYIAPPLLEAEWPHELYHLDTDPYELVNVADAPANAAELADLLAVATGLSECRGASCAAIEMQVRP